MVIIYYPNPGHSLTKIDRDFGRIETNKKHYQIVYFQSEYERIIKKPSTENHFEVILVNHP